MESIDKTKSLETKSIKSLLWEYALPAVASQVVTSVYNIVDRIFLGNCDVKYGALYLAALAITFPVMNIIHAFGSLVGAGSSARMSIVLGRKDVRWAEKILGNSMLLTFFFGFLFVTAGYVWMRPILTLFAEGASAEAIDTACNYMNIVLPGMFLVTLTFNLVGLIRASGYPMKSMWIMVGGALFNILLDYLFIHEMGWGVRGAAWGTTISMGASSVVAIAHFIQPSSFIRFRSHAWAPKLYIFRNILAIGISPFLMNTAAFAVVAVINYQLTTYGGDPAMATYGVVNSVAGLIVMMFLGVCQGMQPIAGYNYGAGHNDRLREVYVLTMKVCLVIGFVGMSVSLLIPRTIINCFNEDPEILRLGVPALRYLMMFAMLIGYTIVNSQLFQSIDKPWISIVTSLSRQVIFLIPFVLIVPNLMFAASGDKNDGVTAVWLSAPVCDFLGAALSTVLLLFNRKVFHVGYVPPLRKPRKEAGPKSHPLPQLAIHSNASLLAYNTFGIDAQAEKLVELHDIDDFRALTASGLLQQEPFFILGGGSNVVMSDKVKGVVVHPANKGIRLMAKRDGYCLVEAEAGEIWKDFVLYCVEHQWYGLENLAAIPGTVGAAPVQNVGAYGREAKDVIASVHYFDTLTGEEHWIEAADCGFAYRWSVFKGELKNRCLIDRVVFRLSPRFEPHLEYKALASALADKGWGNPTASQVVETVTAVRDAKLPNPAQIGSAGSFFKNPVVANDIAQQLQAQYPDMVTFPVDDTHTKLAAGWLIEHCGWKGRSMGRAGVYEKQALVLVNLGGCTGSEVRALADAVIADVRDRFGITLDCEAIFV